MYAPFFLWQEKAGDDHSETISDCPKAYTDQTATANKGSTKSTGCKLLEPLAFFNCGGWRLKIRKNAGGRMQMPCWLFRLLGRTCVATLPDLGGFLLRCILLLHIFEIYNWLSRQTPGHPA